MHKMSDAFHSFVAGIFYHLPALFQFMAPHHNSLRRFKSGYFVGNYHIWGNDNKEAPIRAVAPLNTQSTEGTLEGLIPGSHQATSNQGVSNVEIKCFDHTSNMYFAFAAIIASGIDGIKRSLKLPDPVINDPSNFDEQTKKAMNL